MVTDLVPNAMPMVMVIFPRGFPDTRLASTTPDAFPLIEIMRDGDNILTVSDQDLLTRVANHFDLNETATTYMLTRMLPHRPSTGNITIQEKAVFGHTYTILPADETIDDVWDWANDGESNGTKYPGMTYEEGVVATLNWLFNDVTDDPRE